MWPYLSVALRPVGGSAQRGGSAKRLQRVCTRGAAPGRAASLSRLPLLCGAAVTIAVAAAVLARPPLPSFLALGQHQVLIRARQVQLAVHLELARQPLCQPHDVESARTSTQAFAHRPGGVLLTALGLVDKGDELAHELLLPASARRWHADREPADALQSLWLQWCPWGNAARARQRGARREVLEARQAAQHSAHAGARHLGSVARIGRLQGRL